MKKLFCLLFALVIILSFSACSSANGHRYDGPWADFGNIRPVITVNGEKYYYGEYFSSEFIPKEYSEIGNTVFIGDSEPLNNLEIKSGTEISGKVFVGDETNTTIYILADSPEWAKDGSFRFVSEKMVTEPNRSGYDSLIYYGGNLYELSFQKGEGFSTKELPERFVPAGKLEYIKVDNLPQNDFETNCRQDAFGNSVDGAEVFINPDDLSEIYVATLHYWKEGSYTVYTKCIISE